jgi:hypothetical protein
MARYGAAGRFCLALIASVWMLNSGLAWADSSGSATNEVVVPSADRMSWSNDHPFAIGTRTGAWQASYTEPGLGGHIRYQPWRHVGIEAFSDNFAHLDSGTLRRDHVNGFDLFFPLVQDRRWSIAPQFGACDDFQFVQPFGAHASGPSVQDVLIGLHGGFEVEARIGGGLAVEASLEMYGYLGHGADVEHWTAELTNQLQGTAVAVGVMGFNYYF